MYQGIGITTINYSINQNFSELNFISKAMRYSNLHILKRTLRAQILTYVFPGYPINVESGLQNYIYVKYAKALKSNLSW